MVKSQCDVRHRRCVGGFGQVARTLSFLCCRRLRDRFSLSLLPPQDDADKSLEGGTSHPGEFIDWLLDVVEACDRVLAPHGSLCFELGHLFREWRGGRRHAADGLKEGQPTFKQRSGWHRSGQAEEERPGQRYRQTVM